MYSYVWRFFFFFFFSSRRRHTRYWRDWSSDVCSSDLRRTARCRATCTSTATSANGLWSNWGTGGVSCLKGFRSRSEERRVGKECRSRWSRCDEKKKKRTQYEVSGRGRVEEVETRLKRR